MKILNIVLLSVLVSQALAFNPSLRWDVTSLRLSDSHSQTATNTVSNAGCPRNSLYNILILQATPSDNNDKPSLARRVGRKLAKPFRKAKGIIKQLWTSKKDEASEVSTLTQVEEYNIELPSSSASIAVSTAIGDTHVNEENTPALAVATPATTTTTPSINGKKTLIAKEKKKSKDTVKKDRSLTAASHVDLTGYWNILVGDSFKEQYDNYLAQLGQPSLVRSIALSIVGLTTEEIQQAKQGRELMIRGQNVRGVWERTLTTEHKDAVVMTADGEQVETESWWEQNGTVHHSWMRGVQKYGGGSFESIRYIKDGILVCESVFHPDDQDREKVAITWHFSKGD